MKLLDPNDYGKVIAPLRTVTFNALFAKVVVEGHIPGRVFVDNPKRPGTFLVLHPYGMSLLFGAQDNGSFDVHLLSYLLNEKGERNKAHYLQVFPVNWDAKIAQLLGPFRLRIEEQENSKKRSGTKVVEHKRINFRFNKCIYLRFRQALSKPPFKIVRTTPEIFDAFEGAVVPKLFWSDATDFLKNGIGFSLLDGEMAVSTSFSAFVLDRQLELGVETMVDYQGKGLAKQACAALIDFCLQNGYEPVWSCRKGNAGSYMLATRLGFEPVLELPYYQLEV